jgi:hypothetical protein
MSQTIRSWVGAGNDSPRGAHGSASSQLQVIDRESANHLIDFLKLAHAAWGQDPEYRRLWGTLNLGVCMWIFRKMVLTAWSARVPKIQRDQFVKLLTALSADAAYPDWLMGRNLTERDRSPCYQRIKEIFTRRLHELTGRKHQFPTPGWTSHS